MYMKNTKGFTLIELLVVIAIIGILSSVVLVSLSTARAKSRDAKRISDLGQVEIALELYFDTYARYPTSSAAGLQTFNAGTANTAHLGGLVAAGYIPKLPTDPTSAQNYVYCPMIDNTATTCNGTTGAAYYVMGALLERTDNVALATDSDKDVGTAFYGKGSTSFTVDGTAQPGGSEKVYDVTP